jgi:hypothetical protein
MLVTIMMACCANRFTKKAGKTLKGYGSKKAGVSKTPAFFQFSQRAE